MTYSLIYNSSTILRNDGAHIPLDPLNMDYVAYQAWVAEGNTPNPAVPPPTLIPSCQLWQLQSVMTAAQWAIVTSEVTSLNDTAVTAFFQHGTNVIPANSTTLLSLGAAMGLSAVQVTALVTAASTVAIS